MRGRTVTTLGVMAALVLGGAASANAASAEQRGTARGTARGAARTASGTPVCSATPPGGTGWVLDSSHTACLKCQEAGRRLEATGRWRTYCLIAGGVGPVLLFRYCVACLRAEAPAGRAAVHG